MVDGKAVTEAEYSALIKTNADEQGRLLDKATPQDVQLALSTRICQLKQEADEILGRIHDEKRASRDSGIIDMEILRDHGEALRLTRLLLEKYQKTLRSERLKPLRCESKAVEGFWEDSSNPPSAAAAYSALLNAIDPRVEAVLERSQQWAERFGVSK